MSEIVLLLAVLLGAVLGGALVWRWTAEPVREAPGASSGSEGSVDALQHELERARRFERPFSLIRFAIDDGAGRPVAEDDARPLFESLRSIDVAWIDDDGVLVLLPEVGRAEGEACLKRLRQVAPPMARTGVLAVFPEDGLTQTALLATLDPPTGGGARQVPHSTCAVPRLAS